MKHTEKSKKLEINLVGRLQDDIGLGAAAGRTLAALRDAGIGIHEASLGDLRLIHRINLLYAGLSTASRLTTGQTRYLRTGRYTIAQYYWELPKFPDIYRPALALANELWAASRFTQSALAGAVSVPVHLIPPPVVVSPSPDAQRSDFGLPDHRTIYLFSFNATSHYERKNPEAVVRAFQRAFGNGGGDGPLLVVKSQYLERYPTLYRKLSRLVEQTGGVFISGVLTRQQMTDLLACADIYISLHRAEGFGLGMAEAMKLGKPVIGTNYSGNTDFMTPENSYPVDFKLRPITPDDHYYQPDFETVYEAGQLWAEPDIDQAADFMARLYEHPQLREHSGAQAARDIADLYAPEIIAQTIRKQLEKIDLTSLPAALSAVEPAWRHWGRRVYHAAVPTPLRLAFRRMRRPGERLTGT
jgi:glycosyltransferase involved in cell wall biosynthesis